MWDYRARVDRVIDGDTVVAYLDKGTYDYSLMDVRLAGVWCPERGQPGYAECKAFTQAWVDAHTGEWPLIVTTERIQSGEHEEQSFTRYIATITANPDVSDCLNVAIEQFRVAHGYGPGDQTPNLTLPAPKGTPVTYALGRKAPINKPALRLAPLLTGVIPDHPATVDYGTRVTDWQMLGNDQYGDCVAVCAANDRHLVTTWLGDKPTYWTQDQVFAFYKTQNPNFPAQDDGMVIQTALEELNKNGGPDGVKAVAFAQVDVTNPDEMRAAVAIFGGLWYGINVTQANMSEFNDGQAWDYVRRSPNLGGHATKGVGYDPELRFVTWAAETEFTDAFVTHQLEEAWVAIWPEHLGSKAFQQGVDLAQLAADYKALTGRDFPATPPPDPVDPPSDVVAAMVAATKRILDNKNCPKNFTEAAVPWLAEQEN